MKSIPTENEIWIIRCPCCKNELKIYQRIDVLKVVPRKKNVGRKPVNK